MNDLTTEQRNQRSTRLDELSAREIVELMNAEDAQIAAAVFAEREQIAQAIQWIAEAFRAQGRLFYIGAGTSGRLGVLDASECPPTFSTPPSMVIGIIAGGPSALTQAIEGAEDNAHQGARDLQAHGFRTNDVLVGIATSGRTPYVIGALEYARSLGAKTIGFTCNRQSSLVACSDLVIAPVVGPEVLSGSTRLKAGTATKMVLNMLTTASLVLIGKTYGNLMVDLRASNAKLRKRSIRIVSDVTNITESEAIALLRQADGEVKTAIVSRLARITIHEARQRLAACQGRIRLAITNAVDVENEST
jgi:N-acetylmuramic acid 6-phosphate etherase